jgi:hypothetical protein
MPAGRDVFKSHRRSQCRTEGYRGIGRKAVAVAGEDSGPIDTLVKIDVKTVGSIGCGGGCM